jgi:hypothetical protein
MAGVINVDNLLNWFLKDLVNALVRIVTTADNRSSETAEIMGAIKKNRRLMEVIPFLLNIVFQDGWTLTSSITQI